MNRRARLLAVTAGSLFLLLTALVWSGTFTWLDRYAVHNLMPWAQFRQQRLIDIAALVKPQAESTLAGTLVSLWTYPASPFISGLIVLLCAWRLRSFVPIVLWVAANALELAGKLIVSRPSVGEPGFSDSFPSGHTVRAFVTVAVVAWVWRRARWPGLVWAVGVACALVATGDHVPTDVVGGALLAACLVALTASRTPTRASGSRP